MPAEKTNVVDIAAFKKAPISVRSKMDTIRVTPDTIRTWATPPFQRPLKENEKVRALAEIIKSSSACIPGVLTVGIVGRQWYIVDGQHRLLAFTLSGLAEAYVDVRICTFDTMAEMGEEFVSLNSSIVKMNPDDVLRGLEGSLPALHMIRKTCSFVGYESIRRGAKGNAVISMSTALRCWFASATEAPSAKGSALAVAKTLTEEEASLIIQFLNCALTAWGRDPEYYRLWSALNLTLCMWLWRRTVLSQTGRSSRFTVQQFIKGLMALSADSHYVEWLLGRNMGERDRSPCYGRLKVIFARRLTEELGHKAVLPQPAWHLGAGGALNRRPDPG